MKKIKKVLVPIKKFHYILNPKQRRFGVFVLILSLVGAFFETVGVSIIVPLIEAMLNPVELIERFGLTGILNIIGITTKTKILVLVVAVVISAYIIKNLFLIFLSYIRAKYACKIQQELSVLMLKSYVDQGYSFFLQNNTADFIRGVDKSVAGVYLVIAQFFKLVADALTIVCICIYVMASDIILACCIVTLAVLCILIILFYYRKKMKKCGEEYFIYSGKVNKTLLQTIQGIKEILVMHREKFFVSNYDNAFYKLQKTVVNRTVAQESPAYVIESVCVAGLITSVCIRMVGMTEPQDFIPQLGAFAIAAFRILPSLGRISNSFNTCIYYAPCVDDVYNNIKELEKNKYDLPVTMGGDEKEKFDFKKEITCSNLTFRYPNSQVDVLNGININIKKGQSVAIIGKSGVGKTTLADILLGLLNPQLGEVQIDGININQMAQAWGTLIGFVPQTIYLLDDTIRNNIAFGEVKGEIDDEKIWAAVQQAQLEDMVNELPRKLDTEIGDRGLRISGGQRQRLAIARALYNNPEVLLLDEATSALDTETERAVIEAIDYLQGKKTIIIIAHRLTTIRKCDVIYEIQNGKAVLREDCDIFAD